MRTIKIFLASSSELKDEREQLDVLVGSLNTKLYKQGINILLIKWENLDSSMGPLHKQEEYNRELKDCELCLTLFWKKFGEFTKVELDTAYQELCAGHNPQKLYVYFKDGEELSEDIKSFRDGFPEKYGHFYCHFQNIDTLKADFLLQFMDYMNAYLKSKDVIEIKDSQVSIGGKIYVNLKNVPFAGNNEEYNQVIKSIKTYRKLLEKTETDDPEYVEYAKELHDLEEKQSKMEESLWDTALMVTKLSTTRCSERLQRAMSLFEKGDNKGAQAILNEEEIDKDVEQNLHLLELGEEGKNGLNTNFNEYRLKIQTLESEMPDGFSEQVHLLYDKCDKICIKVLCAEDLADYLSTKADFYSTHNYFDDIEDAYLCSNSIYKNLNSGDEEIHGKVIIWNLLMLSRFYIRSGRLKDAENSIKEALDLVQPNRKIVRLNLLNHLAFLYQEQLEYKKAENTYLDAIRLFEGENVDDDAKHDLEQSYYYLSRLYRYDHKENLAIEMAEKALSIYQSIINEEDVDKSSLAIIYTELGNSYDKTGRVKDAEEMFCKAEIIDEELFNVDPDAYSINLICDLANLSRMHRFQNRFNDAILELEKAMVILRPLFHKYPIQYAEYYAHIINDLAYIYKKNCKYEDAINLLNESLITYDLLLKTDAQSHKINKRISLNHLGCAYVENKQYVEARSTFTEVLTLTREIQDEFNITMALELAQVYINLGYLETLCNEYHTAELYNLKAIDIYKSPSFSIPENNNADLALLELNHGWLMQVQNKLDLAEKYYIDSLSRFRNLKTVRDTVEIISLEGKDLLHLAEIKCKQKKYDEALNYAIEANVLIEPLYSSNDTTLAPNYLCIQNEIAWIKHKVSNDLDAISYSELSVSLARKLGDKRMLRMALDSLAIINRSLKKFELAEKLFIEILELCDTIYKEDENFLENLVYEQKEMAVLYLNIGSTEEATRYASSARENYLKLPNWAKERRKEDINELEKLFYA